MSQDCATAQQPGQEQDSFLEKKKESKDMVGGEIKESGEVVGPVNKVLMNLNERLEQMSGRVACMGQRARCLKLGFWRWVPRIGT